MCYQSIINVMYVECNIVYCWDLIINIVFLKWRFMILEVIKCYECFVSTGSTFQFRFLIRMGCFHWCPPCLCITCTSCSLNPFTVSNTSAPTWSHLKTWKASLVRAVTFSIGSDKQRYSRSKSCPCFFKIQELCSSFISFHLY